MKTITYRGEQYEVDDWVNFVATDADGAIYAYENEPYSKCGEWLKCIGIESTDWENSLEKV